MTSKVPCGHKVPKGCWVCKKCQRDRKRARAHVYYYTVGRKAKVKK